MPAATKKSALGTGAAGKTRDEEPRSFTEAERAAIKARAQEQKRESRRGRHADKVDGENEVLAAVAAMPDADRALAERIHALVMASAPDLWPRTWYGMPAYAKDGKVICFFQSAGKFKVRYATLGFNEAAKLDEGHMWPVAYALTALTPADEARIAALVKQATS